ncbi:MAG: hypothetical protein WCQ95_06620 [Bacteroidota bacterium]
MENNETPQPEKPKKSFSEQLKNAFKPKHFIGLAVGATAGFLYYYFVGCASGACALKANPYYDILLGALLGYLIVDMFKKKKPK